MIDYVKRLISHIGSTKIYRHTYLQCVLITNILTQKLRAELIIIICAEKHILCISFYKITPGGTRTHNPQIIILMHYPLRHWSYSESPN